MLIELIYIFSWKKKTYGSKEMAEWINVLAAKHDNQFQSSKPTG